jgi:hypothetical protein
MWREITLSTQTTFMKNINSVIINTKKTELLTRNIQKHHVRKWAIIFIWKDTKKYARRKSSDDRERLGPL